VALRRTRLDAGGRDQGFLVGLEEFILGKLSGRGFGEFWGVLLRELSRHQVFFSARITANLELERTRGIRLFN